MFLRSSHPPLRHLRSLRGIAVFCLLLAYLFTGALHGACHLDVVTPASGALTIAMPVTADNHQKDSAMAADHHCHGCFSITIPAPMMLAARTGPVASRPMPLRAHIASLAPGIDTPPPKHLT